MRNNSRNQALSIISFCALILSGCVTQTLKDGKPYEGEMPTTEAPPISTKPPEQTKARVALIPRKSDPNKYEYHVLEVYPNTTYAKAGIKNKDVIVSIDGKLLDTMAASLELPAKIDAGTFSQIQVRRAGKNYILKSKNVLGF